MNVKDVTYAVVDVLATNNLLEYLKPNEDTRRVLVGGTLAGLGYAMGPQIRDKLQSTDDILTTSISREHVVYAAGGAALGGLIGYATANDLASAKQEREQARVRVLGEQDDDVQDITSQVQKEFNVLDVDRPGGLITVLSTAWLGYSLFVENHTADFRERQMWGLGLGATGYLAGPELFEKIQDIVIPDHIRDDVHKAYSRGGILFGGATGALLGIALKNYSNAPQYLPRGGRDA